MSETLAPLGITPIAEFRRMSLRAGSTQPLSASVTCAAHLEER